MVLDSRGGRLFHETFHCCSPVEVGCGIDCFSPKIKWRIGDNHHRLWFLSDGLDHAFANPILIVSVGMT
jgi:hypothetical protein